MSHPRYSPEPVNSQEGLRQIAREEAINAIQSQSITGSMVPRSVPQLSVDIPIVSALPQAPEDGQEVYLRVGDNTNGIAHMLYLASLPGWVQTGMSPIVTTLPTSPFDGMRVDYVADSTNGVVWSFRYRAAGNATYPWEFVGGTPLLSVATGATTRAVSTYGDLAAGAATTFTLALAGDYIIDVGANLQPGSAGFAMYASFSVAGATALDTDAAQGYYGAATDPGQSTVVHRSLKTGLAAGTTIQQKFKAQGAVSGLVDRRFISIVPVRVGV